MNSPETVLDGFQVPEFYMPFPAAENPHLEEARPRVRAWAQSIGLLEPQHAESRRGGWTAGVFDRADFTYFTALTYPHACPEELELLSGWHSVIWCLDDIFLPWYEELGHRAKVLQRIDRLLSFLSDCGHGSASAPEHPVEQALADLWLRTAPSTSHTWQRRFIRSMREFLYASLWEADNLGRVLHPDLIEQIEMRRDYGAAGCSALLMEHSFSTHTAEPTSSRVPWEVPEEIRREGSFTRLIDAFRDTVDMHNDIVSYPKEVAEGVARNNIVYVTKLLHGLSLRAAIGHVNTLLTSRVRTLEATVANDIPQTLRDVQADGETRAAVFRHAKAIQGWAAGSYRWHESTARYQPTGPGLPGWTESE